MRRDIIMKLMKILIKEFIRAIIFGWIVLSTLSFFYRSGNLSLSAMYIITVVLMVVVFVSFTIVRIRTGHEPELRGSLGWSIFAAIMYALALTFMSVGVVLGQAEILLPNGFWSVAAWVIPPGLFAWLGYKSSETHPPQN
jgi:hypothetical protein